MASPQLSELPIRVLIISDVRFLRESLAEILPREGSLSILGLFADVREAVSGIANSRPDIVLLDAALAGGLAGVEDIRSVAPQIPIVVIAVAETSEEVIGWAEAGASGYIPKTAALADIVPLLVEIRRGGQICSASLAAGLLRQLSNITKGRRHDMTSPPVVTAREAQIAQLIVAGMSNKEIARCLNIGVATTKTHVHHLLGKLNLQRRGQVRWMRGHPDRQPLEFPALTQAIDTCPRSFLPRQLDIA